MSSLQSGTANSQSNYETSNCSYFTRAECRSCTLLGVTQGSRLSTKFSSLKKILLDHGLSGYQIADSLTIPTHPWGSRNKVKVSITGSSSQPTIGIVRTDMSSVDLRDCPLMPPNLQRLCNDLPRLISTASLTPYDIKARQGELKGAIAMINHDFSQGIVRFVLRSSEAIPRIRKIVPLIQAAHSWVRVVSCNIQPLPAAILEGPEEVILTPERVIEEQYGATRLLFAPQSFMQVTHQVAEQLYRAAAEYVRSVPVPFSQALDLFCGVGGFSLSIAPWVGAATGLELSEEAIRCATAGVELNDGVDSAHIKFHATDVEDFLCSQALSGIDLVIANPPRRGLSERIIARLKELTPRTILYSSCNPETFARDLQLLCSNTMYRLTSVQAFDMFPLTNHCEVFGIVESV